MANKYPSVTPTGSPKHPTNQLNLCPALAAGDVFWTALSKKECLGRVIHVRITDADLSANYSGVAVCSNAGTLVVDLNVSNATYFAVGATAAAKITVTFTADSNGDYWLTVTVGSGITAGVEAGGLIVELNAT